VNFLAASSWRHRAACATHPVPLWTEPVKGAPAALARRREAVAICHGCPVRHECLLVVLDDAANTDGLLPIFGGTNAAERAHWRKTSSLAPPPRE